jgi:hypothetical protein
MSKARDPYDLTLTPDQHRALAVFLCDELQRGLDARGNAEAEVDYWHQLYEQARTRTARNRPWADAADLTSHLGTEKVDALHARLLRSLWTDPLWSVEGWGDAADRAPFVEEFHQWKVEEEQLRQVLDRWLLCALIEPRGLLEVAEGTELRTTRKRVSAKVLTDPETGAFIYDDKMQLQGVTGEDGKYIQAGPDEPALDVVVDDTAPVRTGPVYRVLPYRDSVILPGHARDEAEIWAYGKRFWRRYGDLQRKAKAKIYDKDAVDKIRATSDKQTDAALARSHADVPPEQDSLAETELWEVLVLLDLSLVMDDLGHPLSKQSELKGERWYLATLHLNSTQLLRFQHDDFERSRFVPMILFPRPDRATEGFSFIGHKLITSIEEHTAVRNMRADRAAMQAQAPIKRLQGALWDPNEQPWGPRAVIDVRDMREIEPMEVPDVTQPLVGWAQEVERNAERLAGISDISSGQFATENRTATETSIVSNAAEVRINLIIHRALDAIAQLGEIRHAIWTRVLAEQQTGMDIPQSMVQNLEGRGVQIDKFLPDHKIMAALLGGAFRFKPRGSSETADPGLERQLFLQSMQLFPMMMQTFPLPGIDPIAASRAMWREFLRVMRIENKQPFLGSPAQDLAASAQVGLLPPMAGMLPPAGPQMPEAPQPSPMGAQASPPSPMMPPPNTGGFPG